MIVSQLHLLHKKNIFYIGTAYLFDILHLHIPIMHMKLLHI